MSFSNFEQFSDDGGFFQLVERLRDSSGSLGDGDSIVRQLTACGKNGVFKWFLPLESGGWGWNGVDITRGYLELAKACLTTTFVITQRSGACRRLVTSDNEELKAMLLPDLASGNIFATVGISHLTTSRRHLKKPVLQAIETDKGFVLNGYSPWVTGSTIADYFVLGATLPSGQEILVVVSKDDEGVSTPEPPELVALSASQTGSVVCKDVVVDRRFLVSGPTTDIMQTGTGANTGGTQTSTLAMGLARAAIDFINDEGKKRENLSPIFDELDRQWDVSNEKLMSLAKGESTFTNAELRTEANSLVLRATQSALSSAKGAGFVTSHPAGRWCREALFFLVWSCPQNVVDANLCELAKVSAG